MITTMIIAPCWCDVDGAGVEDENGVGSGMCVSALGYGVGCCTVPGADKGAGNDDDGTADNFGMVGCGVGSTVVVIVGAGSGSVGRCVRAVVGIWET
jgi:hypothetical protein